MQQAVIFDLDGTLVDTGRDIAAAAAVARRALELEPLPLPVVLGYVGDGVQALLQRVLGHDLATGRSTRPVAPADLERGLASFAAHYAEHLLDGTRLYPGIEALLGALSADRLLMLATNKPRRFTGPIIDGLGIGRFFHRVVAGDDAPARKPDPAHLAACLAGTGLTPAAVVVVGDSRNDVLAARALGSRAVGVAWGLEPVARLQQAGPDALVRDVAELARELGINC